MTENTYTAFTGTALLAAGDLERVARAVKEHVDSGDGLGVLVFDDAEGRTIELDLRGTTEDVLGRLPGSVHEPAEEHAEDAEPHEQRRGPGRPKLGVVGKEVTLLPRHWEWLASQPGGASVALRKLVEQARRENAEKDRARRAQEAAYRFMTTLAGDEAGYEEATRALFAGDRERFETHTRTWPADVREYALRLAEDAFGHGTPFALDC